MPQVMGNNRQLLSLAVTANSQRHHLQEATTVHSLSMARVEDHLPMGNQTNPVVRTNLRAAMGTAKGGVQAAKVSKLLKNLLVCGTDGRCRYFIYKRITVCVICGRIKDVFVFLCIRFSGIYGINAKTETSVVYEH